MGNIAVNGIQNQNSICSVGLSKNGSSLSSLVAFSGGTGLGEYSWGQGMTGVTDTTATPGASVTYWVGVFDSQSATGCTVTDISVQAMTW
jgi:hypothetical protein